MQVQSVVNKVLIRVAVVTGAFVDDLLIVVCVGSAVYGEHYGAADTVTRARIGAHFGGVPQNVSRVSRAVVGAVYARSARYAVYGIIAGARAVFESQRIQAVTLGILLIPVVRRDARGILQRDLSAERGVGHSLRRNGS